LRPARLGWRESVSLRRFQNYNLLKMHCFRRHGVEDQLEYDPVGTVAFYRERHRVESATTQRVFSALPSSNLSYTPHPNSSTVGDTAWTIVRGLRVSRDLLRSETAVVASESYPDHETLLAEFHTVSQSVAEALLKLKQPNWSDERTVTSAGSVILRQPLGQILWLFHFDAIHHRGQLSTFLRPLGVKVPSIYGPSGDRPQPTSLTAV
jgi:uncharacterized damage-inducible protein DinB